MGGVARVFAGVGIALGGLLLFGSLAALVAFEEAKPAIERVFPTPIYAREDDCADAPCFSTLAEDSFRVEAGMREVAFSIYVRLDAATGPARITVVDPSGDVRYQRVFTTETTELAWATQESATWPAEQGEWTLTRSYLGVRGTLTYDAWGIGLPPGTL